MFVSLAAKAKILSQAPCRVSPACCQGPAPSDASRLGQTADEPWHLGAESSSGAGFEKDLKQTMIPKVRQFVSLFPFKLEES